MTTEWDKKVDRQDPTVMLCSCLSYARESQVLHIVPKIGTLQLYAFLSSVPNGQNEPDPFSPALATHFLTFSL